VSLRTLKKSLHDHQFHPIGFALPVRGISVEKVRDKSLAMTKFFPALIVGVLGTPSTVGSDNS
jgi:hypothetical protein